MRAQRQASRSLQSCSLSPAHPQQTRAQPGQRNWGRSQGPELTSASAFPQGSLLLRRQGAQILPFHQMASVLLKANHPTCQSGITKYLQKNHNPKTFLHWLNPHFPGTEIWGQLWSPAGPSSCWLAALFLRPGPGQPPQAVWGAPGVQLCMGPHPAAARAGATTQVCILCLFQCRWFVITTCHALYVGAENVKIL